MLREGRLLLAALLTVVASGGCGGSGSNSAGTETSSGITEVVTGSFEATTTSTVADATTAAAATTAEFTYTTPRGYSYRVLLGMDKPTTSIELGDPGKVLLHYSADWPSVTIENTTATRAAPLREDTTVSPDYPALLVDSYVRVPKRLAADANQYECDPAVEACYVVVSSAFALPDSLPIEASTSLRPTTLGSNGPPTLGPVAEANQAIWSRLITSTPSYYVVSVDAVVAPFGNDPVSTIGGWADYACPDSEISPIAVFDAAGSEVAVPKPGCALVDRLRHSRVFFNS